MAEKDGRKAFSGMSMWLSVCVSVCLHGKTKMAETTITKLAAGIVQRESSPPINIRSKGQRSQGYKVQKGDRVMHSSEC